MSTKTAIPDVSTLSIRDRVWSENAAAMLTVVGLSYGRVPSEDVVSGKARPIEARLSADGRAFDTSAWHEGEITSEVYVERITGAGCSFHGLVDSRSRHITQAGQRGASEPIEGSLGRGLELPGESR